MLAQWSVLGLPGLPQRGEPPPFRGGGQSPIIVVEEPLRPFLP